MPDMEKQIYDLAQRVTAIDIDQKNLWHTHREMKDEMKGLRKDHAETNRKLQDVLDILNQGRGLRVALLVLGAILLAGVTSAVQIILKKFMI